MTTTTDRKTLSAAQGDIDTRPAAGAPGVYLTILAKEDRMGRAVAAIRRLG